MKCAILFLTIIWVSIALLSSAEAQQQESQQHPKPAISDPISGVWDMVVQGMSLTYKLKLKLEGDKVSGSINSVGPGGLGGSAPISKGGFMGDIISLTFTGSSTLFTGTVKDGKIVGEYHSEHSRGKWEAQKTGQPQEDEKQAITGQTEQKSELDREDQDKLTQLMRAAARGQFETVKGLLAKGANPNIKSSEQWLTALMFASYFGNLEIVKALLEKGAKVDAKDEGGNGPIDWAAVGGNKEDELKWIVVDNAGTV
ncbi:MAG: ankyrin repeat domain-containing protein [Acidobacteria bacterium]|nr:ankyrin repeat domain-containing protein [Acidobacteriota bacterium]